MRTTVLRAWAVLTLAFFSTAATAAFAADTNPPPPRLTVELRDGSRVVGTGVGTDFYFHSALLGKIKLNAKEIRSVECLSTNAAKLTTANGDTLTVSFADKAFALKTGFGKIELAVDSIRKFTVSAYSANGGHHPGLVALWSAEDGGKDSAGNNNAELADITFADEPDGRSFVFNGQDSKARIPASRSLNVGLDEGFTIETWINPANLNLQEICEWNQNNEVPAGAAQIGTHLEINESPGDGSLWGNIIDVAGVAHALHSERGVIAPGRFQHLALTYDKAGGVAALYKDGTVVATSPVGNFVPQTSFDLFLGTRPSGFFTGIFFQGKMKETDIYNRALSPEEIQEDFESRRIK